MNLNEQQIKAIIYIKNREYITNSIYQDICDVSERTALRELANLTVREILTKTGKKKGTKYKLRKNR